MEKFGEALGWAAAVCYFAAVANLFIKQIFRAYIAKLPADNLWKRRYQLLMKLIVKYHRYFGIGAGEHVPFRGPERRVAGKDKFQLPRAPRQRGRGNGHKFVAPAARVHARAEEQPRNRRARGRRDPQRPRPSVDVR